MTRPTLIALAVVAVALMLLGVAAGERDALDHLERAGEWEGE